MAPSWDAVPPTQAALIQLEDSWITARPRHENHTVVGAYSIESFSRMLAVNMLAAEAVALAECEPYALLWLHTNDVNIVGSFAWACDEYGINIAKAREALLKAYWNAQPVSPFTFPNDFTESTWCQHPATFESVSKRADRGAWECKICLTATRKRHDAKRRRKR